jgi:hypothetical protein
MLPPREICQGFARALLLANLPGVLAPGMISWLIARFLVVIKKLEMSKVQLNHFFFNIILHIGDEGGERPKVLNRKEELEKVKVEAIKTEEEKEKIRDRERER